MYQPTILCTDQECRFLEPDMRRLRAASVVTISESNALSVLLPLMADTDVLVTSCFAQVPAALIECGHRLRGIVKFGVGVDNIDLLTAKKRGIPVANCPDYGSGTVAEHAFALMIAVARRLTLQDAEFRHHGWYWPDERFCGVDLEGKTLGIIGLGRIGRKMAQRAAGFDMQLLAYDPYVDVHAMDGLEHRVRLTSLDELLTSSDFVSVHCILTPETRSMLREREFRTMKSSAYLINVSRGEIIDEPALINALRNGWIAGAGLDVFDSEPLAAHHPLRTMPNVVITPHLAWYTQEAAARQSRQAADAVLDILGGRRPRSIVNGV